MTTDGTIKTVTVTPTVEPTDVNDGSREPPANTSAASDKDSESGGIGTGGIVGIAVGVVGAILIAAGAILLWFFKRRRRDRHSGYQDDPSMRGTSSDRMGSAHPEMAMGGGGHSPSSNMGSSNRNSALAIDPRMDPFKQGLYMRNGSQESINTLRDDHDYSRRIQQPKVLRATNPDPENDV